jgi:hypothetical protein
VKGSDFGDFGVDAVQLSFDQGIFIDDDFTGLELQDHEGRDCIDLQSTIGSSHRARVQEVGSVVLGCLQIMRVS